MNLCQVQMISHVQYCWIHVSPLSYFCLWIWYTQAANNTPCVSCVWVKEKEMRENARHQSNPQVCLLILNRKIAMIAENQQWKMERFCNDITPMTQSQVCLLILNRTWLLWLLKIMQWKMERFCNDHSDDAVTVHPSNMWLSQTMQLVLCLLSRRRR